MSRILALNCGSSSLKFGVYESEELLLEGEAEEIGGPGGKFWSRRKGEDRRDVSQQSKDHAAAFRLAMKCIQDAGVSKLEAVGHRVVHGGPILRDHVRLNADVRKQLDAAVEFAPLHLPASLAVIDEVSASLEDIAQVICLDTSFHKHLPDIARTLPFSATVRGLGIERYGFHGLSLESIIHQMRTVPRRVVIAHLGNGSSITAVQDGTSVDTSMGLTPTGGVLMGTRCGDADPGVLIYLLRHGFDARKLEALVDMESGLKGVSENSSDVRKLSELRHSDAKCDLALKMFVYQVTKTIAAMTAALSGLDLLVFTGGIGEHAADLRDEILRGLAWMGSFQSIVLPAQEDLQIARITATLAV